MSVALEFLEELIENVLEYIPSKQLGELMCINSHWYSAAQRVKKRRIAPCWIYVHDRGVKQEGDIVKYLDSCLNEMYLTPSLVMTFLCTSVTESCGRPRGRGGRKRAKIEPKSLFQNNLPSSSHAIHLTSYSCIGTDSSSGKIQYSHRGLLSFFWPERKDLSVRVLKSIENFDQDLRSSVAEDDSMTPKLVMVFYTQSNEEYDFEKPFKTKCCVVGCRVTSIELNETKHDELVVAFLGTPNIQVASVVVSESHIKRNEIEEKLTEFLPFLRKRFHGEDVSDTFDVRKHSSRIYGYVFACVNRFPHHNQKNHDLEAFAKVLPGVPLFGIYGYGEIGSDSMNQEVTDEDCGKDGLSIEQLLYFNSSVFVLVTL